MLRKYLLVIIFTEAVTWTKATTPVSRLAEYSKVHFEVVRNPTSSSYGCKRMRAGWGFCAFARIHILYYGEDPITDIKWSIYIHSVRRILKVQTTRFTVDHINGDLYKLTPTKDFHGFRPGYAVVIPLFIEFWIVSYSDIMPNMFVASEHEAKAFKSTTDVTKLGAFASGISGSNFRKSSSDRTIFMDSSTRFIENNENNLHLLPKDAIRGLIIPSPKRVKLLPGNIDLSNGITFGGEIWMAYRRDTKEAILSKFQSFGIQVVQNNVRSLAHQIIMSGPRANATRRDAYVLRIRKKQTLIYGNPAETFYGLQSILSLIEVGQKTVPEIDVTDFPRFPHRGMMVDVARNFKSKEVVYRLLDQMAYFKLNTFHFHLSDDEGWRVEIPGLEELTDYGSKRCYDSRICLLPQLGSGPTNDNQGTGYYTVADYEDIVRYAHARFIKVIPEIDMPGHSRAAVMSMEKRFEKYKDTDMEQALKYRLLDPDDNSNFLSVQFYDRTTAINPCMESSNNFVEKVISELQIMHNRSGQPLKEWHFGGDEVRSSLLSRGYQSYRYSKHHTRPWQGSKVCKKLRVNVAKLPYLFMKKVRSILRSKGIDIMHAWSDAVNYPAYHANSIGAPITLTMWDALGRAATLKLQELARRGYSVVNAMPDFLYFDMPYEANPFERGYYWATRSQSLRKVFSFAPICLPQNIEYTETSSGLRYPNEVMGSWTKPHGKVFRINGIQGQIWGETVRTDAQLEYMVFPRLIALAERAWRKGAWEYDEISCPGTYFGCWRNGRSLHGFDKSINTEFNKFANVLGQRELRKLDLVNVKYRLPLPGYRIQNRRLEANIDIPGIKMEYSLDNGVTWHEYIKERSPLVPDQWTLKMRSVTPDKSRFRIEDKEHDFNAWR